MKLKYTIENHISIIRNRYEDSGYKFHEVSMDYDTGIVDITMSQPPKTEFVTINIELNTELTPEELV